jgi:hypothetical protein
VVQPVAISAPVPGAGDVRYYLEVGAALKKREYVEFFMDALMLQDLADRAFNIGRGKACSP